MVSGGTNFRKEANKRRKSTCRKNLHLSKKNKNTNNESSPPVSDTNIVNIVEYIDLNLPGPSGINIVDDIDLNIISVGEDEAVPEPSCISERKLDTSKIIPEDCDDINTLPEESPTGYRFFDVDIPMLLMLLHSAQTAVIN